MESEILQFTPFVDMGKRNLTENNSPDSNMVLLKAFAEPQQKTNQQLLPFLTESKLDLIEEKESLRLQLKKQLKKEKFLSQKINKLMYFFFKLENKGVPIYKMYQMEGLEKIYTDRFDEIMDLFAKNQPKAKHLPSNEQDKNSQTASFLTEDSYENLQINPDIYMKDQKRPFSVPKLSLQELPSYVTTSED